MAQFFRIHPRNPQPRLIRQVAEIVRGGGVIVYPTDSLFALGCQIGDKEAMERIRRIRRLDDNHNFTLVSRDLSQVSQYAKIENEQYRLIRAVTPGPYTFVLPATREVPRRLQHPKRRTVGLRIPGVPIVQMLLEELGEPLMSVSLILPEVEHALTDAEEIRERLEHVVDAVVDGDGCGLESTTVVEWVESRARVTRIGAGDPAPFY
jgi:tRNA threonylcarbamoyl adenosine modification protein (Sua5/YciO/YrdC/YwlC family)